MNVKDVTLLMTRPDELTTPLAHHLSEKDLQILQEPLLQVLPLADPNLFIDVAKQVPKEAWAIFVSPTAACFASALWHQFLGDWPSTFKFAAVGQSTARVLHEKGITHVLYPKGDSGAQALFALLDAENLYGKTMAVFRATTGKPMLLQLLQRKGAIPLAVPCYERRLGDIAKALTKLCQYSGRKVIICTSSELARAMLLYDRLLIENKVLVLANHPQIAAIFSEKNVTTKLLDSMNPVAILDKIKENP